MYPFEKKFLVIGEPVFDDPIMKYPNFGKDLEKVVAMQELKFGETCLCPPKMFDGGGSSDGIMHFEYRIFKGKSTRSEYEAIEFDYFQNESTLRVYSVIPEIKASPIVEFIAECYLGVLLKDEAKDVSEVIVQCRSMGPSFKLFELTARMLTEQILSCLENGDNDIQGKWWMKAGLELLTKRPKAVNRKIKGPMRIGFTYPESVRVVMIVRSLYEALYSWISECHPEQLDSYRRDYNSLAGQALDIFDNLKTEEDWVYRFFTLNESPSGEKYNIYNPKPFECLYQVCCRQKREVGRLKCGQVVNVVDKNEGRYSELEEELAACAKVKPCIFRYNKLSKVIVRGLTLASEGRPDFEVWKSDWLTAALQLLGQNPCPRGVGFIERQQLLDGIAPIIRQLQNLMQLQMSADPDMTLEEYDAFYQTFNNSVLHGCIKKDKASHNIVISISYDFLTREEGAYGWAFEPLRIQQMAQHCAGIDSIEKYRQRPISPAKRDFVEALNALESDETDHRAMAAVVSLALVQARTIVPQLEDSGNSKRHLIIADLSNFQDMMRPFFAPYYKPFTRTEPIKLDDGTSIDANTYLEELISLVDRFMAAIVKASNESENARVALNCWREILSLYRNRLAQPYQELTRESQEGYSEKVFEFSRLIVACAPAVERAENGDVPRYYKQEVNPPCDSKVVSKPENVFPVDEQGRLKVVIDGATPAGAKVLREITGDKNRGSTNDGGKPKMNDEHAKRCVWMVQALEEHRKNLKTMLADKRGKKHKLAPPTVERLTELINGFVFKFKHDENGLWLAEQREGVIAKPLTQRQVRTSLEQALGMTIDDIKHIYMAWKEDRLCEIHHASITTEHDYEQTEDVDLASGGHNWGEIKDEEAEYNQQMKFTIGKPKSRWMKKCTKSYNKLKASLEAKEYRFDYRIFMYWIGLRMESFVNMPKAISFKTVIGTVHDVEGLLESLSKYKK